MTTTNDESPGLSRGRAWAVTMMATATMAISYLDRQVLAVLAPTVQRELELDDVEYGALQSAFSLSYLVAAPLAGWLLERVGVRRGMLFAVLSWSAVSALHAGMSSFAVLFALRIALGATEAPSFPGSAAAITRAQPPAARPRALGVLYTGSSLGAMIAPPLATALSASVWGWRGAFVGVAVCGLVWVPLWLAVTGHRDVKAALAVRPDAPRTSPWIALRHPAVLRASLLVAAASPIFAFVLLWSAKVLVEVHGVAEGDVGQYLPFAPLLFDLGAVGFGHFASVHARERSALSTPTAVALTAAALAASVVLLPFAHGPWSYVLGAGIALAGGGGLFAVLTADMVSRVGPHMAASAGGITAAVQSIMYVLANPAFGWMRRSYEGYAEIFVGLGVWLVPGVVGWILWRPAAPPAGREADSLPR